MNWLFRCATQNSIHNVEMPSKMSYLRKMFLTTIAEFLEITVFPRIQENVWNKNSFSCHVDFIVNQICRFASTAKKKKGGQTLPWSATEIQRNDLIFVMFRVIG